MGAFSDNFFVSFFPNRTLFFPIFISTRIVNNILVRIQMKNNLVGDENMIGML